jgi:hypothetical protein
MSEPGAWPAEQILEGALETDPDLKADLPTRAEWQAWNQALVEALGWKAEPHKKGEIEVPALGDIFHLWPGANISAQAGEAHKILTWKNPPPATFPENAVYNEIRSRAGRPVASNLTADQLARLAWKKKKAIAISRSPSSQAARSVGQYANAIDNVTDAATTAAWGGKGALWLLRKIGLKGAVRLEPMVGAAFVVKDVFDAIQLMRVVNLARDQFKKHKVKMDDYNPFSQKAKVGRASKMAAKVPGFGAAVEIAQTTDSLFGVGLSLGPVVGFIEDLYFGLSKYGTRLKVSTRDLTGELDSLVKAVPGARSKPAAKVADEIRSAAPAGAPASKKIQAGWEVINRAVGAGFKEGFDSLGSLIDRLKSRGADSVVPIRPSGEKPKSPEGLLIRGLEGGAAFGPHGQAFDVATHVQGIQAAGMAYGMIPEVIRGRYDLALGLDVWDVPLRPRPIVDAETRLVLEEIGQDPDADESWGYGPERDALSLAELAGAIQAGAGAGLAHWLPGLKGDPLLYHVGDLIQELVYTGLPAVEGPDFTLQKGNGALSHVYQLLAEHRLEIPAGLSESESLAWLEEQIRGAEREGW